MRIHSLFLLIQGCILLLCFDSYSQNKRDLGVQIGSNYYYGELNETMPLYQPSASFGAIFRYNYNRFYSIRLSGSFGTLKGSFSGNEHIPNVTNYFEKKIINIEAMLEFNFIEFNPTTSNHKKFISPYLNVGIGGFLMTNKFSPCFPFSAGIKYTPGKRHTIALEWRFHKTFTDEIDNYSVPNNNKKALIHNNDWFSFIGIIYSYRLFDRGQLCPVYK